MSRWDRLFNRRRRMMEDLDQDIRDFIERETQDNIERGIAPEEAHFAALRKFGNVVRVKEETWEVWNMVWLEQIWQDLRQGARMLAKNPSLTVVAVLTLALGIGANTAIFSLANAVLLRNLPVADPRGLVLFSDSSYDGFSMTSDIPSGRQTVFSYPFYLHVRDHSRLFQGICAFQTSVDTLTIRADRPSGSGATEVALGKTVSGNFFSVLGVRAAIGRTLTPADDQPAAPPVAMLSFNYWQDKLGGDPAIVGRSIAIDGAPMTVVGVAPPGFFGVRMEANSSDFWIPLSLRPRLTFTMMPQAKSLLTDPNLYWLNVMGRLAPGASLEAASAEADGELRQYLTARAGLKITEAERQQIQHAYVPLAPGGRGLSHLRHESSERLRILLAIVALVLLIACANVASLMLARVTARQREMATRLALGGTRGRLVRQILTESVLLAMTGGAAGAMLAFWGVHVLLATVAAKVPLNVTPNLAVLSFAVAVSLLTAILSGLAPALRSARAELVPALKDGRLPGIEDRTRLGLGKNLVVFEIAASLVLLVAAGLLLHSLVDLEKQDLGFRPQHVLLVNIDPHLAGYKPSELASLYRTLLDRVGALPGVRSASIGTNSPMSGSSGGFEVSVEGQPPPAGGVSPQVEVAGPGYFDTEGMSILAGRPISTRDTAASSPVAVANEAFVRKYIPSGNPVGRRFSAGPKFVPPGLEIVGVAGDARFSSPREVAEPMVFLSAFQLESVMTSVNEIEIRTAGDPTTVAGEVRQAIHQIDANLPITNVTTLAEQVSNSMGPQRMISVLTGFFGILGLALACVGLYGIMAYNVARRTHELGVRMALGAQKGEILKMIMGHGLRLTLIGLAIGAAGALALTRLMTNLLYGVRPSDPLTFIAVSLLLTMVALLACYIPARRAMKVDPMVALRYE
jgi:predicted permease